MAIMKEFREFAIKGSVVDLAVGVIIGAAFVRLVDSLVKDLIMPVISRVFGGLDFSNWFIMLGTPPPGYSGQRRPSRWSGSNRPTSNSSSNSGDDSIEDAVAGLVMDAATKFIGGAIGRRVKRAYEERVVPAVTAKQDAMLREQIAIAERYPELRACLTDNVVFLAGGNRVVPMSSLSRGFTLEQADAVVAQLRNG